VDAYITWANRNLDGEAQWTVPRFDDMDDESRRLPWFIVTGAPKAGTTFLRNVFNAGCDGKSGPTHEMHFWDGRLQEDFNHPKDHTPEDRRRATLSYYAKRIGHACPDDGVICHDFTPSYMAFLSTGDEHWAQMEDIAHYMPYLKAVAILRDPVERYKSEYGMNLHRQQKKWYGHTRGEMAAYLEECGGFDTSFPSITIMDRRCIMLYRGLYADHLEQWYETFGPERLCVMSSSRLKAKPLEAISELLSCLGVDINESCPDFAANAARSLDQVFARSGGIWTHDVFAEDDRDVLQAYYDRRNAALLDVMGDPSFSY